MPNEKNTDEKELKITDRRHSATQGDNFVMDEAPPPAHNGNQIDFSTFVLSLATGALINLGLAPDPMTSKIQKNLEHARQNIELLGILKEKTKGNLSNDETKLLDGLLTEARLKFVEVSRSKA